MKQRSDSKILSTDGESLEVLGALSTSNSLPVNEQWRPTTFVLSWFVIGAYSLDVQLPSVGVNIGNLALMGGALLASALAIHGRVLNNASGVQLRLYDVAYVLYLLFALASTLWSLSPSSTAVQIAYLGAVWLAVLSLAHAALPDVIKFVVWLAVVTAVLSFMLILLSRDLAFQPATSTDLPELRGIFSHQLRLGLFMSVALGFLVIAALNGELTRVVGRPLVIAVVVTLVLSCLIAAFARLYTAAMILALAGTIFLGRRGWLRWCFVGAACALLIAGWFGREGLLLWLTATDADITLTGRTVMWAKTLAAASSDTWLGFGYATFDSPRFDWLWGYYRPAHPHNSYIQAYFETGLIGLGLTVMLVATHFLSALSWSSSSGRYSYSLYLVLLMSLGSITGSNYAGKPSLLFCLTLLVLAVETRIIPTRVAHAPVTS